MRLGTAHSGRDRRKHPNPHLPTPSRSRSRAVVAARQHTQRDASPLRSAATLETGRSFGTGDASESPDRDSLQPHTAQDPDSARPSLHRAGTRTRRCPQTGRKGHCWAGRRPWRLDALPRLRRLQRVGRRLLRLCFEGGEDAGELLARQTSRRWRRRLAATTTTQARCNASCYAPRYAKANDRRRAAMARTPTTMSTSMVPTLNIDNDGRRWR